MIGIFKDGKRIGSLLHFTDGPKHRFWAAYSFSDVSKKFKTKKAAIAWLVQRHEQCSASIRSMVVEAQRLDLP